MSHESLKWLSNKINNIRNPQRISTQISREKDRYVVHEAD
jgi:hypothetical protein